MKSNKLRIVYLIGELGLGGSERQLYLLLKHMDGNRFERHVVALNRSQNYTLDEDLRRAGVTVHNIPLECNKPRSRMLWIYRLVKKVHPHILHSWSIHDNVYAGVVGTFANVPLRLGSVRSELAPRELFRHSPLIQWLILHSVQGHLVNSATIVDELMKAGVAQKRIYLLYNCVEIHHPQNPVPFLEGVHANGRFIGMVANLRWQKNHILFIRGMARIIPEFADVYGVLVGQPLLKSDPSVPDSIQYEINKQGIQERMILGGFQSNVPEILPHFEIFCLTSNSEGTPNAILEAMAAGLPVVATRVGGIPHLVQDGVTGVLIEPDDVNGLSEALRDLLRHPEKGRQMGLAGRTRVQKEFSCDIIVRALEEYYLSNLTQRSRYELA